MSIYKRDTLALVKESVNSILLQSHVLFDFYIQLDGEIDRDVESFLNTLEQNDNRLILKRSLNNKGMPLMNTIMNGLMLAVYWIGTYLIDAAGLKDKLTVFSNMVVFSNYSVQVIMSFLLMSMVFVLWPRGYSSSPR